MVEEKNEREERRGELSEKKRIGGGALGCGRGKSLRVANYSSDPEGCYLG